MFSYLLTSLYTKKYLILNLENLSFHLKKWELCIIFSCDKNYAYYISTIYKESKTIDMRQNLK